MDSYCERYHCRMTKLACDNRKSKAKSASPRYENVFRNAGCATCKGVQTMEEKPKRCSKCGEDKPRSDFHQHRECADGLDSRCKACKKLMKRKEIAMETKEISYPELDIVTGKIIFETPASDVEADRGPKEAAGKPNWAVFPFAEAEAVVKVFEYGSQKYGAPFTYRKGIPDAELWAATMRHLIAIQSGEDFDRESGCHHMAHVAANALMYLS